MDGVQPVLGIQTPPTQTQHRRIKARNRESLCISSPCRVDAELFGNRSILIFLIGDTNMPHPTFRRWTADDIAKLKNMAQKEPCANVAAQLGRSVGRGDRCEGAPTWNFIEGASPGPR